MKPEVTTIRFLDRDDATGDALAAALHDKIDSNFDVFVACLRAASAPVVGCGDSCNYCTQHDEDALRAEDDLHDAVGFAQDSLRLARVIEALS